VEERELLSKSLKQTANLIDNVNYVKLTFNPYPANVENTVSS